ncbi:MAG: hypothetical protein JXB49_21240 [Bacteroidales bacterium]|nr:hypothetical protein [Bacteroidales bacterium]
MKTILLSLSAILLITTINSCTNENDETPVQGEISGELINTSDCKYNKSAHTHEDTPDTLSCIKYTYDKKNQKLIFTHYNAAFNCCPGELSCNFSLGGDTIIVEESEEMPGCHCNCLYDLDMQIEGILSKKYIIKIIEPYVYDSTPMIFEIDLTNIQQDEYCLTRKFYPYGESLII